MDIGLSDTKRESIISSYSKFGAFWAGYLPFAVNLLRHFLDDMHVIVRELTIMPIHDTEEYKGRWDVCTNLFE